MNLKLEGCKELHFELEIVVLVPPDTYHFTILDIVEMDNVFTCFSLMVTNIERTLSYHHFVCRLGAIQDHLGRP